MKIIFISFFMLSVFVVQSQATYFTKASSGLIIRDAPSVNANRIGKLPYGSLVELLETTEIKLQIIDDGDTIDGVWVKVKFQNFPFVVSETEAYEFEGEGYVFNKFIEKLNKARIETKEIDSLKFHSLYIQPNPSNTIKITSEKEAENLLASKVKWKQIENLGWVIDEVILDNGQILNINQKTHDYGFRAYYPSEEILLFVGGHESEYSISLKTGESIETAGNPELIVDSPSKNSRLNGWFSGQECVFYFFQEKIGNDYRYVVDFGWGSDNYGKNICYFQKFCWLNDQEFMYYQTDYAVDQENGEKKYFIGQIIK